MSCGSKATKPAFRKRALLTLFFAPQCAAEDGALARRSPNSGIQAFFSRPQPNPSRSLTHVNSPVMIAKIFVAPILQEILWGNAPSGVTASDLAEAVGRDERTIYRYAEDEERNPPLDILAAMSRFLMDNYGDARLAQFMLGDGWVCVPPEKKQITDAELAGIFDRARTATSQLFARGRA